ncbi:MAG: fibronectin type III domain-containing protein, partial [Actinobacteria bacterium]|nr:fibronectin type III domain-containing protein [Actinomycetota bacterium]
AATPTFYLRPATPAGVTGLKVTYNDVQDALLTWKAPTDRKPEAYLLKVTRVADQKLIIEDKFPGDVLETPLKGLDARGMFVITLQALNTSGVGPVARLVLGDEKPNPVKSIAAIRDPGNPKQIIVTWLPSDNTLKGNVIGYEIGYGAATADQRVFVKVTEGKVVIPADRSTVVIVRVLTDAGKSRWSKDVRVPMDGNRETTTTNPSVDLVEQSGVVTVAASQALASGNRLVVRIAPTLNNGGFTDTQYSQAGAQTLSFRTVPQGMYLVTVEDSGTELARRYVNVGKAGYMFAGDWKTTMGSPKISDAGIEMPVAGETRVLSTKARATQDVVISTDAQLTTGDGYGFWFRTSNLETRPTGLTFQYDPKWNGSFIVRQWQNGTECGTPIATTKFPAGLAINGNHRITMAAEGDTLFASLDGVQLFNVPSLSTVMSANKCGYAAPTGTQIGLRKWTTSTVLFKDITVQ